MAIQYIHPETGDLVNKEQWRWVAVYLDGTQLEQFELKEGGKAIFHRFAEIEQDKLHLFKMVHDTLPPVMLVIPKGAKLIHKYRNFIMNVQLLNQADYVEQRKERFYLIGYELDGKLTGAVITHQNELILTDDFDKVAINA